MNGIIVKGVAGFYFVKSGEKIYRCKARGIFKERGIKPAVGDRVQFDVIEGNDDSIVTDVLPRKNSFIRPFVANVDCFCMVVSVAKPSPVLRTVDRFLVMAEMAHTEVIICLSKCDLCDASGNTGRKTRESLETLKRIYGPIYPVVCLANQNDAGGMTGGAEAAGESRETGGKLTDSESGVSGECAAGDEIERLKELIKGRFVALAGASGTGKSTLINRLAPDISMETGDISEKSGRGKHTTRYARLFDVGDPADGTMVFDTPGFTSFDVLQAEPGELQFCYPEIGALAGKCRYDNCRHMAEPDCAVKEAVESGRISPERYASYTVQMEELLKK